MKKTTSHAVIPHMLSFLLLLSSFFAVLLFLKNPDPKPLDYDQVKARIAPTMKPHLPAKHTSEPESKTLSAPVPTLKKTDDESALRLLQENPNHIEAADELYASYEKRQDWEGALAAFQKLESENEKGSAAGFDYGLGRLYLELGHPDQARVRLEEALESDPDNPMIREQLAAAYNNLGEREWARREWERLAQDESAGRASYNAKIRLAEDLFAEGRWAEAEAYAKDVLKQDPHNRLGTLLTEH
jgi:tetratricopeptide (TPR) repeat protein